MSRLGFLNQTTFRVYTYKYRSFFTPIIIIGICSLLLVFIITPQIKRWFAVQQAIAISQRRVEVLTRNLTFAGKINSTVVDKYLQLVSKALPNNKAYIAILAAISNASV